MSKKRNYTLEIIKLLAAYMVVFIHVPFPGQIGRAVSALARFAVPLFFLISGFYSYGISSDKCLQRTKNILLLFVISMSCFTIPKMILFIMSRDVSGIFGYFGEYLDVVALKNLVLFNVPVHADYLWYLLATIYVYLFFWLVIKCHINEKMVFACGILLLGISVILSEGCALFGESIPYIAKRSFIDMGIPFFVMGLLAKKYEQHLQRVPLYAAVATIAVGIVLTLVSLFAVRVQELYLGSIVILFGVVVVAVKYADISGPSFVKPLTGCSTYIYVLHPVLSGVMIRGYAAAHIGYESVTALQIAHPFLVCIIATVLAYGMTKTVHKWVFR